MLEELEHVVLLKSSSVQLIFYDTTFQLDLFLFSYLSTLFQEALLMPAALMIHA